MLRFVYAHTSCCYSQPCFLRIWHASLLIYVPYHWQDVAASTDDGPLRAAVDGGCVTFVHQASGQRSEAAFVDGVGADAPKSPAAQHSLGATLVLREPLALLHASVYGCIVIAHALHLHTPMQ